MRKFSGMLLGVLLGGGLLIGQAASWAQSQFDVVYQGGHPQISQGRLRGTLRLQGDHLVFQTRDGRSFSVPYEDITTYQYDYGGGYGPIMGVMGPNPIMLATSLGVSALQWAGAKMKSRNDYQFMIEYQDHDAYNLFEITLNVSDQRAMKQLYASLRDRIRKQQTQPQAPEVHTVSEPETDLPAPHWTTLEAPPAPMPDPDIPLQTHHDVLRQ